MPSPEPDAERGDGFSLGHRPALDGLRGLAVLAVMAYHCGPRSALRGGFLGVDLFFVLSGFLVTVLLLEEYRRSGCLQLRRFYGRRVLRLFPALLVMLAACCVFAAFRTRPDGAREVYRAALLTACYAANWNGLWSLRMGLLGHAWSLSLEGQFYVVWPLLLCLLFRAGVRLRQVVWLVMAGIAAAALVRAALWMHPGPTEARLIATSLVARSDSLLAGCLVGLLTCSAQFPGSRNRLQTLACVSTAVLAILGVTAEAGASYMVLGGYTVAAASSAVVVAALIHPPPPLATRVLSAPVLVWIGRISYGLYLWHFPLLTIAPKLVHGVLPGARDVPGLNGALAVGLAFAAATLSYYMVERPFLRWKSRLSRLDNASPSRPTVAAALAPTR